MLVDYPVQGSLVRQLIFHWTIACLVIFIYLFCMQVFTGGFQKSVGQHMSDMWNQYGILLIALMTVFPVFAFDSIRLSHRFAGPMVPFGRALEKLSKGESIEPVNFRESDFWTHLSTDLNAVANKLNLISERQPEQEAK